tara:strand:- start:21 stop:230 length:210 start_codon:yes stop_codon:yes gene_type:complete
MDDEVKLLKSRHKLEVLNLQIQIAEMENKIQKLEKENRQQKNYMEVLGGNLEIYRGILKNFDLVPKKKH